MPDVIPETVPQEYEAAVPLDRLTPHPANPNSGDAGLIGELLDANGFVGAVLAQKSTGLLIDGEHRWIAARQHGMPTIPVVWVDVDDDTRDRLLASLNESVRAGRNDETKLVALLQGLAVTPKGLTGTAFDGDDLDRLVALLDRKSAFGDQPTDPNDEWEGMPDFDQPGKQAAYTVHIGFATEEDADRFFELIERPRMTKMWWPQSDGHRGSNANEQEVWAGAE